MLSTGNKHDYSTKETVQAVLMRSKQGSPSVNRKIQENTMATKR